MGANLANVIGFYQPHYPNNTRIATLIQRDKPLQKTVKTTSFTLDYSDFSTLTH